MSCDLAGQLNITLTRPAVGIAPQVTLQFERPINIAAALHGKPLADVPHIISRLLTVCAVAHTLASQCACAQAIALPSPTIIPLLQTQLLRAEMIKEHLWRVLLDWPRALGQSHFAPPAIMTTVLQLWQQLTRAAQADDKAHCEQYLQQFAQLCTQTVFAMPALQWLHDCRNDTALQTWARHTPTIAAHIIHQLVQTRYADCGRCASIGLEQRADFTAWDFIKHINTAAPQSIITPQWAGRPHETTPYSRCHHHPLISALTRQYGNGLLPRFVALCVELARAVAAIETHTAANVLHCAPVNTLPSGHGIASIAAARGLLIHHVISVNGQVAQYHILPPTAWNCHPHGVIAAGLMQLPTHLPAAQYAQLADLYVTAIDPCVCHTLNCIDHPRDESAL